MASRPGHGQARDDARSHLACTALFQAIRWALSLGLACAVVVLDRSLQDAELTQRHHDGVFKEELARAYEIHVETVRAIVRRAEQRP